jgi:hypothetical protein
MIKKSRQVRDYKLLTKALPTERYVDPKKEYIHLQNGRCNDFELYVEEGEQVLLGQVIGKRFGGFFEQPIHATISGTVGGRSKKVIWSIFTPNHDKLCYIGSSHRKHLNTLCTRWSSHLFFLAGIRSVNRYRNRNGVGIWTDYLYI